LVRREPVPPGEFDALANYLQSAPMLAPPAAAGPDLFDPQRGDVVPSTWHTDGQWIWSGSVIYYLHVHGLAPQPELLDHIRRQRYVLAAVSEDALRMALAVVTGQPIPEPRPAAEDAPQVTAEPARDAERPEPPALHEPVQPGPEVPVEPMVPAPRSAPQDEHPADSPELRAALARAAEAAEALDIGPDRYCVDGVRDNAWCLSRDGSRWRVFQQRGESRKGTEFDTVHEAVEYFVGHLYLHRDELRAAEPAAQELNGSPAAQAGHDSGDHSELPAHSTDSSPAPNEDASAAAESPSIYNAPSATGLAPSA
jgi:hypothetical protein